MISDDAKAVVALTTRLGSSGRPSLSPRRWHRLAAALVDAGMRPADVFGKSASELTAVAGDDAEAVAALVGDAGNALLEADELRRKGIWILTIADEEYPGSLGARLGPNAPPILFGVGEKILLSRPGVGIVGSRDVDSAGGDVAQGVAVEAVRLGRPVVSGGARGVDQIAMNAAFQAGGAVVGVLADSLLGRIRKPETLTALDGGNTCLISQQSPAAGFSAASAMGRNKLIYALADVTVVVASALESGGTWGGATEALKAGNGVVAVWRGPGEGEGNHALATLGARPISDVAELGALLGSGSDPSSEQLSLY